MEKETMFVAIHKKNKEPKTFTWAANDNLLIDGKIVDKNDYDIVEIEYIIVEPIS